jgi:ABC-type nitrate/sulfonate/bicarbonate transport system substrate-binding protein
VIHKNIKIAILASVFLFIIIAGYLWQTKHPPLKPLTPTSPLEKISLGINAGKISGLVFIAQDQGYFRDNGLEADLKIYETGRDAIKDLLAGKLDVACCAEFVLVNEIFAGHDNLRILGSIGQAEINELITRKDGDINQPADLQGKRSVCL